MSHKYCISFQYAFVTSHHEAKHTMTIISLLCPNVALTTALGPHRQIYTGHRNQRPQTIHGAPAVPLSSCIQDKEEASLRQNI